MSKKKLVPGLDMHLQSDAVDTTASDELADAMGQEHEEEDKGDLESDIFDNFNMDDEEEEDKDWLEGVDGDVVKDDNKDTTTDDNPKKDEEEEEDEEGKLNFNNKSEEGKDTPSDDLDLEAFNKKLNKDFKTQEELLEFLGAKKEEDESSKEQEDLDIHTNAIDTWKEYLELSDEKLLEAQIKQIRVNKGEDINDPNVAYEIEEELQRIKDSNQVDLRAEKLRGSLKQQMQNSQGVIDGINQKRTQREEAKKQEVSEQYQTALSNIFTAEEGFYGVKPTKQDMFDVYKEANDGSFLDKIKSQPELLVELALMHRFSKVIKSKATGKTYADGIDSVLDELGSGTGKRDIQKGKRAQTNSQASTGDDDADFVRAITQ